MRYCIKEPTVEVHAAIGSLIDAVEAHVKSDYTLAAARFEQANCPNTWNWLNDGWINVDRNVVFRNPDSDSKVIPKSERDPDRSIASSIKKAVLERDGYRCRYCGLPVVHADIRKIAHQLYPAEVPWNSRVSKQQHSGFQVTWLQFDHVVPHSHGGRSSLENVVVSCALCNFGKDRFTLKQLNIEDPRMRGPVPSEFDGLERLRPFKPIVTKSMVRPGNPIRETASEKRNNPSMTEVNSVPESFFFVGAKISSGYVLVPPIAGKSRWFKIGPLIEAEMAERNGVQGCVVHCPREMIDRRGIKADDYLDVLSPKFSPH